MTKVFLFTSSYPYSLAKEETFLRPELEHIKSRFSITVIPLRSGGGIFDVPDSIEVRTGYADSHNSIKKRICGCLRSSFTLPFWKLLAGELFRNPKIAVCPAAMKKIVIHLYFAISLMKWMKRNITTPELNGNDKDVYYSFWFDSATTALCLLKKNGLKGKVVTKAHGFDLYDKVQPLCVIPFRRMALEILDRVLFISRNGLEYMSAKYPEHKGKYLYCPMGVNDRKIMCGPSGDGVFRIVSCSSLVPGKRVDLIIRALAELGNKNRDIKWEWLHIGDGPEMERCREISAREVPDNVAVRYLGYLSNVEVFKLYQETPLDLFILLSASEGRPVSLMEAASCGLPIVATDVGGVGELVKHGRNGMLLPPDTAPGDVAEALMSLRSDENTLKRMRKESRIIFDETANASKNYAYLSDCLESLSRSAV
ncbi:MAG TPA: glycosyltransferase [Acidobacteriota bacterium]|nr:glycosyltransferase [Acidobacteriota bacterium]